MTQSPAVRRVAAGNPWQEGVGCARAVRVGDLAVVSGTLPVVDGVLQGESDPYVQARTAFGNALGALRELGMEAGDVVSTRMYLAHARDVDAVGRAHQELFGAIRPAATLLVVSGFVDSRVLVQVEVEAYAGVAAASAEPPEAAPQAAPGAAPGVAP